MASITDSALAGQEPARLPRRCERAARIRAIQRTGPRRWNSAVWQERRATLLAPVVYWRSLMSGEPAPAPVRRVVHLGIDVSRSGHSGTPLRSRAARAGRDRLLLIQNQQHFLGRQQIRRGRIETVQVGRQEARGIADPPVGIGATLENLLCGMPRSPW